MTGVAECAVIEIPNAKRGSIVRAHVVLKEGHQPNVALVENIQEFAKRHSAPYKYPRSARFIDARLEHQPALCIARTGQSGNRQSKCLIEQQLTKNLTPGCCALSGQSGGKKGDGLSASQGGSPPKV